MTSIQTRAGFTNAGVGPGLSDFVGALTYTFTGISQLQLYECMIANICAVRAFQPDMMSRQDLTLPIKFY